MVTRFSQMAAPLADRRWRVVGFFLVLSGVAFGVVDTRAQVQPKTVQIRVPLDQERMPRVALDSLTQYMGRRLRQGDSLMVRRAPDAEQSVTIAELEQRLADGPGLGFLTTNRVTVKYRVFPGKRGIEATLDALQFSFVSSALTESSSKRTTALLYLDVGKNEWARTFVQDKAVSTGTTPRSVRRDLSLASLLKTTNAEIVEIDGDRPSRRERAAFVDRIEQASTL